MCCGARPRHKEVRGGDEGFAPSATAFVTFRRPTAKVLAKTALLSPRPFAMRAEEAPEPRDVIWENVYQHIDSVKRRQWMVNGLVVTLMLFWTTITGFCANATKLVWRVAADDADPAGYATCVDAAARLCFVVVRNSGHEAPSYAPRSAYDLHARFVRQLPFDGAGGGAPTCDACDGAPPFAGPALPGCRHRSPDHTHWHERLRVDFGAGPAI